MAGDSVETRNKERLKRKIPFSSCCKARVKLNPIEWSSPSRVKTWVSGTKRLRI